jgi:hypothetical protein
MVDERRDEIEPGVALPARLAGRSRRRRSIRRRRTVAVCGLALAAFLVWLTVSVGGALTDQALGSSVSARFAEWVREHGGSGMVNWVGERVVLPPPPAGGWATAGRRHPTAPFPASDGWPAQTTSLALRPSRRRSAGHPGEGQWSPAGRLVGGIPAVYETTLRPDAVHTSYVVGVAWMDTKLLRPPSTRAARSLVAAPTPTPPRSHPRLHSLVAAFNAGFLMSSANGGYYTDGRTILPLRTGAASFVVYRNGTSTVAVGQGRHHDARTS